MVISFMDSTGKERMGYIIRLAIYCSRHQYLCASSMPNMTKVSGKQDH